MELVVSPAASEFVRASGGRLFVWTKKNHCCGGGISLGTATEPPPHREFRTVTNNAGIELFVPVGLRRLPDELHLDVQRWPRRVQAYWNGCVFVV
jgi:hypothetical protein